MWALFAGAGFAALVAASEVAYLVLRVVGAAVLFVLGFRALRAAWRERGAGHAPQPAPPAGRRRWWGAFGEGVVVQLANPKAAVFMIAFYPQFVPADGPVFATTAVLGLLQITLETVLYLALAAGVARAGALVPPAADPAPAGGGQRLGPRGTGSAGRALRPLSVAGLDRLAALPLGVVNLVGAGDAGRPDLGRVPLAGGWRAGGGVRRSFRSSVSGRCSVMHGVPARLATRFVGVDGGAPRSWEVPATRDRACRRRTRGLSAGFPAGRGIVTVTEMPATGAAGSG